MNKRINLLTKKPNYLKIESYFNILRLSAYITVIISIVVISISYLISNNQKKKLDGVLKEKDILLNYFVKNKDAEAEFIFFSKKDKQLQEFLKEDKRIVMKPYYQLLNDSLSTASSASLLDVVIKEDRSIQFSVGFSDYNSLKSFGEFIESSDFLDKFSTLKMNSFSAFQKNKKTFDLSFTGILKELNENKN